MNIRALDKLEKGYVKWNWRSYIYRANLSDKDFDTIVDIIDNFKKNKSAKELVIFKLKNTSFYITVNKSEYSDLLGWLKTKFLENEMYESCIRLDEIKNNL